VPAAQAPVERVVAARVDPASIKLDPAGYFVIYIAGDVLAVEHYSYREELLRVIEGRDARGLYLTLIGNGWVSRLDHAAYLGKELARAESSMKSGLPFVQDGA
jgi:tetrahydromethanopterin S-methyltransferase subunit A